ncbi:MAG: hypothetical protein PVG74_10030 [Desulfobacterales bacterium]|jgi:hypothetical protein
MNKISINPGMLPALVLFSATLLAAALTLCGCGKKASPKPPSGNMPPAVTDLTYSVSEDILKLSWTIPKTNEKAKSQPVGFLIYRSKQTSIESDCPNCPVYFKKIGDVLIRNITSETIKPTVVFSQEIEPGYRYLYKIKAYNRADRTGNDSNLIDFTY